METSCGDEFVLKGFNSDKAQLSCVWSLTSSIRPAKMSLPDAPVWVFFIFMSKAAMDVQIKECLNLDEFGLFPSFPGSAF